MARRTGGLRDRKSKSKAHATVLQEPLDYHEGLSLNQVKIVLREFGFTDDQFQQFSEWMGGQTCPFVQRDNRSTGKSYQAIGVYEYDLFRWIASQKKGTPLIFD